MTTDKLVQEIVDTYELDDRIRKKVIWNTKRVMDRDFDYSFSDIYNIVASFVDRYNKNHKEVRFSEVRNLERLVKNLVSESETMDEEESHYHESKNKPISYHKAIEIIAKQLDNDSLSILLDLVPEISQKKLKINEDDLLSKVDLIKERLELLIGKYYRNGRIILPPGKIKSITFDPTLKIKLFNRDYKGNPLQYFWKHYNIYKGMSRTDLKQFDEPLYSALHLHGQIQKAIPGKMFRGRRLYTEEDIRIIKESYQFFWGVASDAARALNYGKRMIEKTWTEAGLEVFLISDMPKRRGRSIISQYRLDRIISSFKSGRIKEKTILKKLENVTFLKDSQWQIPVSYIIDEKTKSFEMVYMPVPQKITSGRRKITQKDVGIINGCYTYFWGIANDAAKILNYSKKLIMRIWTEAGYKVFSPRDKLKRRGRRIISQFRLEDAAASYERGDISHKLLLKKLKNITFYDGFQWQEPILYALGTKQRSFNMRCIPL